MKVKEKMPTNPENMNYLSPHGFTFLIDKLPGVRFNMRTIELPALTLNPAVRDFPIIQTYLPGEKLEYSEFSITFKIDEEMANYIEVTTWMQRLSALGKKHLNLEPFPSEIDKMSDASLLILNSNYNPIKIIQFYNTFPISLSTLSFALDNDTNIDYLEATAGFQYTYYEIMNAEATE